jgi:HAD superfamily hydrolase (TIGR01509 family)
MHTGTVEEGPRTDAVVFDTDGVVTRTAEVHERVWAAVLDEALDELGVAERPFGHADYLEHLDGRDRYDGVAAFLGSRGVELAHGSPADPPDARTVCGIGNRKNERFRRHLRDHGVRPYRSTIEFVEELRAMGIPVAVISASRNAKEVLAAAGVGDLFGVVVDGELADRLGLPGKPQPAVFSEAARRLGIEPGSAAVIEDSISGVSGARAGGFGVVVGVARTGNAADLRSAGADLVVGDLSELRIDRGQRLSTVSGRPAGEGTGA